MLEKLKYLLLFTYYIFSHLNMTKIHSVRGQHCVGNQYYFPVKILLLQKTSFYKRFLFDLSLNDSNLSYLLEIHSCVPKVYIYFHPQDMFSRHRPKKIRIF